MTKKSGVTRKFVRYRRLEERLRLVRSQNEGEESAAEDEILDEMDHAWRLLTDQEQAILREEGARAWPRNASTLPP